MGGRSLHAVGAHPGAQRLGLRSEECWLIVCILRFKYDSANPCPSQEVLASLFGQSVDTIQRVERLRDETTGQFTHTVYDFTPLRFALNECHYQDHPEERPQIPTPQICGLNKNISICLREEESLNVVPDPDAPPTQRPTLNAGEGQIDKTIEEAIALTGDAGSHRRFEQLYQIAQRHSLTSAWSAALIATRKRLARSTAAPLQRPGAYLCRICVQELEKHGVFVPTAAEKETDRDAVGLIRASLGVSSGDREIGRSEGQGSDPVALAPPPPRSNDLTISRTHDLAALERERGAAWESFVAFCVAERERWGQELVGMRDGPRQRLLESFDTPQRRQELFQRWRSQSVTT